MKTKFKTKEAKIRFASNEANTDLLIKGLLADDSKAHSEFFQQYRNLVYDRALELIENDNDVDEIVNDVFLRFFLTVARLRKLSAAKAYLVMITRNACFDKIRIWKRKKATLPIESLDESKQIELNPLHTPEVHFAHKELGAAIQKAISQLPQKQHQAFTFICLEGYTPQATARIMDCTENAVYTNFHRAREFLSKQLSKALEEYHKSLRLNVRNREFIRLI